MSLIGTLNLAGNALAVQQAALQTSSNNISNAGNANYTREVANLSPGVDQQLQPGISIGTGVDLDSISRQIDQALQSRINGATSDSSSASTSSQYLGQVQSTLNALGTGATLSSQLSTFFNDWSNLANNPTDNGSRQVVVQDGVSLTSYIQQLGGQLTSLQTTVNQTVANQASSADTLASDIATLNGQIVTAQSGAVGTANSLLDERDADLLQLSQYMNVQTVPQTDGSVDVYVGSEPLVSGTTSNGVSVAKQTVNGQVQNVVTFKSSGSNIQITSGSLAGLAGTQSEIQNVVGQLNSITSNLIFQVNKLTSSGQGTTGVTSVTATNAVTSTSAALSDTTNSGLKFTPTTGSFVVHVTDTTTGLTTSTLVHIDQNGTGTDTTLDSLTAQLNGIANVTASDTNGTLKINSSGSDQEITFSDDTSGTLAALGINTFFTGNDSTNVAVNSTVQNNLSLVTAAQNGESADNQTALALSTLGDQAVAGLNGQSINQAYQGMVNQLATKTASATADATSTAQVVTTLQTQRQNLSGVSLDEETVNLLQEQNAYQAAARVITTVNTMMTDLMALIPA
jgi:flagellar hook-associated protein 1